MTAFETGPQSGFCRDFLPDAYGEEITARQQALKYAARAHRIFEAPECEENSSWCKRSIIGLLQSGEEKVLLVEDNAAFDSAADVPDFEISTGLLSNSGGVAGGPMLMDAIAAYRADLAMRQGEAGNSNIANLESGPFSLPPDSCAPRQKSSRAGGVRPRRRRWWNMPGEGYWQRGRLPVSSSREWRDEMPRLALLSVPVARVLGGVLPIPVYWGR